MHLLATRNAPITPICCFAIGRSQKAHSLRQRVKHPLKRSKNAKLFWPRNCRQGALWHAGDRLAIFVHPKEPPKKAQTTFCDS